jgi:hypothetical protein
VFDENDAGRYLSLLSQLRESLREYEPVSWTAVRKSPEQLSPETIFSLTSLDARLQTTTSQYLFLREWSEPRRETLANAALSTLREAVSPLSLDEVVDGVQKRILRKCEKRTVSSCLKAVDATFDEMTGKWSAPAEEPPLADEPEIKRETKTVLAPFSWVNQ